MNKEQEEIMIRTSEETIANEIRINSLYREATIEYLARHIEWFMSIFKKSHNKRYMTYKDDSDASKYIAEQCVLHYMDKYTNDKVITVVKKELKECKFCGGTDILVTHTNILEDRYAVDAYQVHCSCGIRTTWLDKEQLLSCWNK